MGWFFTPSPWFGDVRLGKDATKNQVLTSLIECDYFWFYGHGSVSGTIFLQNGESITPKDLEMVAKIRKMRGKRKMKFAFVGACYSAKAKDIWLEMADIFIGYSGLTGENRGWSFKSRPNLPEVFMSPRPRYQAPLEDPRGEALPPSARHAM